MLLYSPLILSYPPTDGYDDLSRDLVFAKICLFEYKGTSNKTWRIKEIRGRGKGREKVRANRMRRNRLLYNELDGTEEEGDERRDIDDRNTDMQF